MNVIKVFITYFLGVVIEYNVFYQSQNLSEDFQDYLFIFGILVVPALFLFIIPISIFLNSMEKVRFKFVVSLYFVVGVIIAVVIIFAAFPINQMNELLNKDYLFIILNGAWFSVLYCIITEIERVLKNRVTERKKAIQEKFLNSQRYYS